MTNNQGYGVYWDDTDPLGRELKLHRYFNTLVGAQSFASTLANAKVMQRAPLSDDQLDAQERSLVQKLNRDELTRLMLEFGFTIRAKDFANWRPTLRSKGSIPGVWEQVELIATDGLLGMFLNDQREPTVGHIQMFDGDVKPLFSVQSKDKDTGKTKKPKKLSKRQQFLQSI